MHYVTCSNTLFTVAFCVLVCLCAVVPDDFTISISVSNTSILAGQIFNLTCTVRTVEGLQNVPTVEWLDETGNQVTTGRDVTVGSATISGTMTTLALEFSPLRLSHGEEFTCRANLTSHAPPQQLTKAAEWDLIVGSEYLETCCIYFVYFVWVDTPFSPAWWMLSILFISLHLITSQDWSKQDT